MGKEKQMRTIIVGDIHGCYKEFITLLRKVNYKKKKDRLILMGDLMDRGPYSYEMLHWAIRWKEENPDSFFLIRGNHEQMIVEQSKELERQLIWRAVGKSATIRSFAKHRDRMENYIPWITENMPIYHIDDGFQCVHAGIQYENFEENSLELLVKDHSWSKQNVYNGKITILGHTPLEMPTYYDGSQQPGELLNYGEWKPLPETGAICIDTGCVYGRKLTAMILEDGQYYLDYVPGGPYTDGKSEQYIKMIKKVCGIEKQIKQKFSK
jgi:serine/threonine protein phosphatase 1